MGGDGHPDDQEHHFTKAQLLVLVVIEILEDLVDRDLILHVLQVVGKLLLNQELQLLPGQGVFVPLPSRVLVEDIDDDINGFLQLGERSLGLAALAHVGEAAMTVSG